MAPYRPNLLGKHRARVAAVLDVDSHSARLEQEGYGVADIAWRFAVPLFDVGGYRNVHYPGDAVYRGGGPLTGERIPDTPGSWQRRCW